MLRAADVPDGHADLPGPRRPAAAQPLRDYLRPPTPASVLRCARAAVRRELGAITAFSLGINLLTLVSSVYMMEVFDRVMSSGSRETLFFLTLIAIAATAVMALLGSVRRKLLTRIGGWLEQEVGGPAIDASVSARLAGSAREGGAATRALADIKAFFVSESVVAFLDVPWAPVFMVVIGCLHPLLGLFALGSALLLGVCALVNEELTRRPAEAASAASRRAARMAEEAVSLAEPAAALGMRTALLRRWYAAQDEAGALSLRVGDRGAALVSLVQFLRYGLQLGILGLGAWLVLERSLTSGGMIAASVLLSRALAPVDRALPAWKAFINARAGARTLAELFRRAPGTLTRQKLPRPGGQLTVDGLMFVPPGAEAPLLRNVSFALQPGEVLGIIGSSGAGKSTLVHLLVGVRRPQRGMIRLDGAALEQ